MKESDHENQHAPLSYRGAHRIVWLGFLLVIVWFVLRSLRSVVLLFAIVFLIAIVLNPIVVWLQKHRVPRVASVILLMLGLIAVAGTIILFAIPPLADTIIRRFEMRCHVLTKSPGKSARLLGQSGTSCSDRQSVWSAGWSAPSSPFCCWSSCWPTRDHSSPGIWRSCPIAIGNKRIARWRD